MLARGGLPVALYDPAPAALAAAVERIRHGAGLLGGDPDAPLARLRTTGDLADAVAEPSSSSRPVPEVTAVNQAIFASLERARVA